MKLCTFMFAIAGMIMVHFVSKDKDMNEWIHSVPITLSLKLSRLVGDVLSIDGCSTVGTQGCSWEYAWCHRVYECNDIQVIWIEIHDMNYLQVPRKVRCACVWIV